MEDRNSTLPPGITGVKQVNPAVEAGKIASEASTAETTTARKKRSDAGIPRGPRRGRKSAIPAPSSEAMQAATMINGMFASALGVIGGSEALPDKKELDTLDAALASYFATKPDFTISPGWVLTFAYVKVSIANLGKPKPRQKVKVLGVAIGSKISTWWQRSKFRYFKKGREHDPNSVETGPSSVSSGGRLGPSAVASEATKH